MKRFLLFSGEDYYPCGGVDDFVRSFSSQEAIIQHLKSLDEKGERPDWSNVLDIHTGTRYRIGRYTNKFSKIQ